VYASLLLVREYDVIITLSILRLLALRRALFFILAFGFFPALSYADIDGLKLGARYTANPNEIIFRVYSARATRVDVYLYGKALNEEEIAHYTLSRNTATNVWSRTLSISSLKNKLDANATVYYGYRAWGPNWPHLNGWIKGSSKGFKSDVDAQGNRFNPNKLLLDPYALETSHDPFYPDPVNPQSTDGTLFASGEQFRLIENGAKAPKAIVLKTEVQTTGVQPARAFKDDVIYEVNVRGLTKNDSAIPAEFQGTYRGAGLKAQQLAALGITAVEFLPVQELANDANDLVPNSSAGDDYWGYSTLNYFSPDRRYAADRSPGGPSREFKAMVKAFHDQGIKVYLDVVYNHTGEGGLWNKADPSVINIFSWRGLDNPTYYELTADMQYGYDNNGVAGNFNAYNPIAQNLIIDSLAHWSNHMGVDGFRFDLATVLGNTCTVGCFYFDKLNPNSALNRILRELPPRPANGGAGVDLIAEPWALNDNFAQQQGNFPAGWSEWNARFRDTLRRSQNQLGIATVTAGQLASVFAGSSNLFQDDGRKPWNSVNFLVAHDGFTLKDLYSCNGKNNNQSWPFGPSDGGEDNNVSWDHAGSAIEQRQAARTGLAFLMLSAGVPMMVGGDEYLRTINCNNNPYNIDAASNWLSGNFNADQQRFTLFAQRLIAFRKAHPALRPTNFYQGLDTNGNVMEQVRWFTPAGLLADANYFDDISQHALAYRVDGSELGDSASAIYIAYNANPDLLNFVLPWPGEGKKWYRVVDTAAWNEMQNNVAEPNSETIIGGEGDHYGVNGRSLIVLIAK
jgi:isoamylase